MESLVIVHAISGVLLVVLAAIVGCWGLARARSIGEARGARESRSFAQLLQLVHTLVLAQIVLGIGALLQGHRPSDELHVRVYGPFMLVAIIASYAYRSKDPVANVRVFSVGVLIVFALGLRALWTGA